MFVPVKNIVETVDLTPKDALLPLFECVVNSIISLMQSNVTNKEIQIKIRRGDAPSQLQFDGVNTIKSITITDNGVGFTEKNFKSFETPFSKVNRDFGCKGIGRFTVLAAFNELHVRSNYEENGNWKYREFTCDSENEVTPVKHELSDIQIPKTTIDLIDCFNPIIKDKTAVSIEEISTEIMHHCLIYYLSGQMPLIRIFDADNSEGEVINDLFQQVSKENERTFQIGNESFMAYITKVPKENNRKNHYIFYCANSRVVGQPKSIGKINSVFSYPIIQDGKPYFLEIYVISDYLNKKNYKTRNGFAIPQEDEGLFSNEDSLSFDQIELALVNVLEEEYEDHIKEASQKSQTEIQNYIDQKAPRYKSLRNNPDLLKSIPPNLTDDKKEEHLYRISYHARKIVESKLQDFIDNKQISEDTVQKVKKDIQEKTAYDVDSLADYMMRRKAIIDLFDKFLEADSEGKYKLEQDIHNIIFPLGFTNEDLGYEMHNLWLLDERFLSYKFIASDKSITSYSQKKSSKEPDLICLDEQPQMFDNPISFGDKSNGEVNSMVIFEFKRPGEVAHQKAKGNYRWQFSELIEPYFEDFLYSPDKKNYKGKQVIVKKETPKFGFVIIDVLPPLLEQYNIGKGWQKTPFGTFYKMEANNNLHIEVMTFEKLLEYAKNRHMPFFDKLFGK
ncbi:hypothetical protein DIU31_024285 [Mucilaginibacter rubeus]|uniref:ATP-binding protein n=1 Tax=Mucilaginibacter rubeus TaxID=2027860 RepID=A0AAE6JL01_9SPHI|nr:MULTISPECIES: hypothetical protein [Mucilaginibacter]QEM06482.1 hypothetical protein DIU31_024285 [Mucilaginibacter rubeus]QEM19068.1 hypothetical protein DIU38_024535 [Mucilaginibacter gossypii]QTE44391.1 hypothetical protein J3L19_03185 [Mucilaginibacter rubeus]QTE50990.1 hypothetical protein J3L21_03160 [Mucilaginibacter rubeus]QTE56074.1 hypothetical protein J3L23_28400 [Mucilaginibacter rubeus]